MKKVMEMKIAKLTLDGYFNYGNILQNYALEQVLLHYAEQVDTIWHDKNNFWLYSQSGGNGIITRGG